VTSGGTFGRFQLRRQLANGTFAQVFDAMDRSDGSSLLVKALRPRAAEHEALVDLFEREIEIQASLIHPRIHSMTQNGSLDGRLFIAFEPEVGVSLAAVIDAIDAVRRKALVAVEVGLAIAEAIAHAHSRGVVHGKLGPELVSVDRSGAVKVSGFGIDAFLCLSEEVRATLDEFAAPERLIAGRAIPQGDVFSLGMVMAAILGSRPDSADDPLLALIARMCRQVPNERPSAQAVVNALRNLQTPEPTLVIPARPQKPVIRRAA
jgi:eukaryotic-like serine/threonine-protein kinase